MELYGFIFLSIDSSTNSLKKLFFLELENFNFIKKKVY